MSQSHGNDPAADVAQFSRRTFAVGTAGLVGAAAAATAEARSVAAPGGRVALSDPGMAAKLGIDALYTKYAWSYDCHDEELFLSLFTPDAIAVGYPEYHEVFRDREALRGWFRFLGGLREKEGDDWQHFAYNHLYNGNGKRCLVYSYATHFNSNLEKKTLGVRSTGLFVSECVASGGEWRFHRFSINHWDRRTAPWNKPLPWAGI